MAASALDGDPGAGSIAAMTPADLDEVDAIERVSFKEPWPAQTFLDELAKPFARVAVLRSSGRVLGFANYWLVAGEASLLAIAVHPDHRGRGLASQLVAFMLDEARATACALAILEVRRGNAPAIALYERHGFVTTYVRKQYYPDGEDALVMTVALIPS
jgi:[ribosomal protein S18]-alanine N-acetyltransferase